MSVFDGAIRTLGLVAGASGPVKPFESDSWSTPAGPLDERLQLAWAAKRVSGARPCSDEVFVRRLTIDLLGVLPTPEEVAAFVGDQRADKRARLIDSMFGRDEYADYWAMRWCDVLRVKAEFPINLWPNAVQAYHRWVRDAVVENRPYDRFAGELLTASGSNFRVAPSNFYRAVQNRDPSGLAEAVALTFMGQRLDSWPAAKKADLAKFFSRLAYKKTEEWKEEIVILDPTKNDPLDVTFPDGTTQRVEAGQDPRRVFAAWLTRPENPYFARAMANRLWWWLMGRGLVHEPDDMRPDNPPSAPAVLDYLTQQLVASKFDLRAVMKLILNSRCYQQSAIAQSPDPLAETLFAHYIVRRLDAEVLADALKQITGAGDTYSSQIPEPFTWIPEDQRAVALSDGSITSSFLEMFGRPPRDTGVESERNNQPTDAQRLYMLNSGDLQKRLEMSPKIRAIGLGSRGRPMEVIRGLYLLILSRQPTEQEVATLARHTTGAPIQMVNDLAWALLNTKEFLYRH